MWITGLICTLMPIPNYNPALTLLFTLPFLRLPLVTLARARKSQRIARDVARRCDFGLRDARLSLIAPAGVRGDAISHRLARLAGPMRGRAIRCELRSFEGDYS